MLKEVARAKVKALAKARAKARKVAVVTRGFVQTAAVVAWVVEFAIGNCMAQPTYIFGCRGIVSGGHGPCGSAWPSGSEELGQANLHEGGKFLAGRSGRSGRWGRGRFSALRLRLAWGKQFAQAYVESWPKLVKVLRAQQCGGKFQAIPMVFESFLKCYDLDMVTLVQLKGDELGEAEQ